MKLLTGDITKIETDAIVNAASPDLRRSPGICDAIFAGIHFCFSGYFCAYGVSGISFLHNILSVVCARIPLAYLASKYYPDNLFPMGCAAPAGSLLSVLICAIAFVWMKKQPGQKAS